jgi:hypothetical protein
MPCLGGEHCDELSLLSGTVINFVGLDARNPA